MHRMKKRRVPWQWNTPLLTALWRLFFEPFTNRAAAALAEATCRGPAAEHPEAVSSSDPRAPCRAAARVAAQAPGPAPGREPCWAPAAVAQAAAQTAPMTAQDCWASYRRAGSGRLRWCSLASVCPERNDSDAVNTCRRKLSRNRRGRGSRQRARQRDQLGMGGTCRVVYWMRARVVNCGLEESLGTGRRSKRPRS